jgi:hypothetical protein
MEEYSYENMSDEELEQLVALGVLDQQEAEKMRLKQRAELVRDRAGPEGIRAGKSFVAASPLSFLAKGLEDYAAGKEIKQLDKELADIQRQQTQGRGTYWDLLRGKRRKPQDISSATSLPMPRLDEEEY